MDIRIDKFSTFYRIEKVDRYRYFKLINYFSTTDYRTKERVPYAYFESANFYKIPLINEDKLLKLFDTNYCNPVMNYHKPFPYKYHKKEITMINPPKDKIQKEVIEKVVKNFNQYKHTRVVVNLATGQGKTYVATNTISRLGCRAIIFVKNDKLRRQWFESFMKHTDCKRVMLVNGSNDLFNLINVEDDNDLPDIIITTHATTTSFIKNTSMREFSKLLVDLGIGIKVFDEFDLENKSMFTIDCNSNTRYTLYLSATDFKSAKEEDRVFKRIFEDVPNIGKEYRQEVPRNAMFIHINSNPSKKEFGQCMNYYTGEARFDTNKFYVYMIKKKAYYDKLEWLWINILKDKYKDLVTTKKIAFYIGRINTVNDFKKDLLKITGLKDEDIVIYNSETPDKDREKALAKKMIITTAESLGRGVDLANLDTLIDFETRSSLSRTEQLIGRVSRTGAATVGTYIQFIDDAFYVCRRNHETKVRHGFYDKMFTKIEEIKD